MSDTSDGGLVVPELVRIHKPGLLAMIYRKLGNEKGWQTVNLYKHLLAMRERITKDER